MSALGALLRDLEAAAGLSGRIRLQFDTWACTSYWNSKVLS